MLKVVREPPPVAIRLLALPFPGCCHAVCEAVERAGKRLRMDGGSGEFSALPFLPALAVVVVLGGHPQVAQRRVQQHVSGVAT